MFSDDRLHVTREIFSQPECWARACNLEADRGRGLPLPGERAAVIGCGTSWFIAQSYAALREAKGLGETDAFCASEFPARRRYDRVVAITRSGTTTEVARALESVRPGTPVTEITAVPAGGVAGLATHVVDLSFADELSVVQTRFATTALALLRARLGEDLDAAITDCRDVLLRPMPSGWVGADHLAFLGRGWTIGLANEAALKCREASLSLAESHPAMDYRHGPASLAEPGRLVWMLGAPPEGLADEVRATGATWVASHLDPMADLVRVQLLAVARGLDRGLDPDHPRHLTRSVVLGAGA
jgi:fructoselysine-6-P-deglycase FrlB-like protein